jgi:hypothetical protein
MSGGGLPAIPAYEIERYHYLHELRGVRALYRVHSVRNIQLKKHFQKELCKAREKHYGTSIKDKGSKKPMAKI